MGEAAKSHCKGGAGNCDQICTVNHSVYCKSQRRVSESEGGDRGWKGKQWSGNHGSPLEMLVESSQDMKLIEKHSLHCILLILL